MIEKSELEAVCAKIPVEDAQRIRDYAKANGKCVYEVLQEILIKGAQEL
jgi:hypothetical protein